MNSDYLVIQIIVRCWSRQECVSVRDENIENVHNLQEKVLRIAFNFHVTTNGLKSDFVVVI